MRRAHVLVIILLAALLLVACGKDDELTGTATTPAATSTAVDTATAATPRTATSAAVQPRSSRDGCRAVAPPQPLADPDRRRSTRRLGAGRTHIAVLRTNCGTIRIRLAVGRAPRTTSAWAGLARNRFFDGLTFHRIAKPGGNDFVIQGGDPLGTGNGGPGYSVVERPPRGTRYRRYDVAMAKTQVEAAGTSGSQFFIVTAADSRLEPDYAILGTVVSGQSVVRRISAVPTDPVSEMPIDPVVIRSVRIVSR